MIVHVLSSAAISTHSFRAELVPKINDMSLTSYHALFSLWWLFSLLWIDGDIRAPVSFETLVPCSDLREKGGPHKSTASQSVGADNQPLADVLKTLKRQK